jgi:pilus assembly protein CpaD
LLLLCGCTGYDPDEPKPDYRIKLMRSNDGKRTIAVPPDCPDWNTVSTNPLENQPWPQYGCSTARNLAAQVVRPEDLIDGRDSGSTHGATSALAMGRYIDGKTRPLVDPNAKAPAVSTGGGGAP